MRIVGGEFRGARLTAPPGRATRPTSDRLRETLFNILANRIDFAGLSVIDLFAGTGALALEALSRGAAHAVFVEHDRKALMVLKDNIARLGVEKRAQILQRDAAKLPPTTEPGRFDLAFADPPYGKGLGEKAAASLIAGNWLADDGLLVLEESAAAAPEALPGFTCDDRRQIGDTVIGFFQLTQR